MSASPLAFWSSPQGLAEMERLNQVHELADRLVKDDPRLNVMSALVIAGDMLSVTRATKMLDDNPTEWRRAAVQVGSYARLAFVIDEAERGRIPTKWVLDNYAELWRGSDPDDTDARFLKWWRKALQHKGMRYIRDGRPLPRARWLTIYRGQDADAPLGMAWTLDEDIAKAFAAGMGTRQSGRNGAVFAVKVPRHAVIAYLTDRNESEVIIDPNLAQGRAVITGRWEDAE